MMKPRERPRFLLTFESAPGAHGVRALRRLLKIASRSLGLRCLDAYEDRSSPLEISNQAADEFRELRDEVIGARARSPSGRTP